MSERSLFTTLELDKRKRLRFSVFFPVEIADCRSERFRVCIEYTSVACSLGEQDEVMRLRAPI